MTPARHDQGRLPGLTSIPPKVLWAALVALAASLPGAELPPASNVRVEYERDIRPLFERHCYVCHGEDIATNGLRLDRRVDALAGGHSGPAILPGDSAESRLIHMVAGYKVKVLMPPAGDPLDAEQIGLLRAWIDQGALWPERGTDDAESGVAATASDHWAFQPIRVPERTDRTEPDRLLCPRAVKT